VTCFILMRWPQALAASLCAGLAVSNVTRSGGLAVLGLASLLVVLSLGVEGVLRIAALMLALALGGWWWGSGRLEALDRSLLAPRLGTAASARVVVTGPARRGPYDVRVPALVIGFGELRVQEPVLLKLPRGRAPPQGVILEGIGELVAPRGPRNGFDERTWLRRHGVHVVLRIDRWRVVGRRGGLGRMADVLRRAMQRSVAISLTGDRAAVLKGVVLGDDNGLSDELRDRFRAAGLYHLLAVSGQNVGLVAGGALLLVWLLGLSRLIGHVAALAAIGSYVLAVGAQPSVIRAGIAGGLASLAWISARAADRWHFLLVGAIALLAWNPYTLLDPGFQFSFAAVVAIFVLVPRFERWLEGYPLGRPLRLVVAVSAACGLATAPIAWLHFHSLQLLTVPANALAAPAVVPLLALALAAAAVAPVSLGAAVALAWLNGWCAAYLASVARLVGGLPFAQIQSVRALLVLLGVVLLCWAYAWPRWRPSSNPST
jgi:competence protein ComEC